MEGEVEVVEEEEEEEEEVVVVEEEVVEVPIPLGRPSTRAPPPWPARRLRQHVTSDLVSSSSDGVEEEEVPAPPRRWLPHGGGSAGQG